MATAGSTVGNANSINQPTDYHSVQSSEIYHFFDKHPQPGGGNFIVWPRIAITLIDAPSWHLDDTNIRIGGAIGGRKPYPSKGCWKFKAKIWESESISKEVQPFYHCTDDSLLIPGGDNAVAYEIWSGKVGTDITRNTQGSTGIMRTEGPNFPDTPIPSTHPYRWINFAGSFTGEVISGVLSETGIDFTAFNDHRVWLNLADHLEPK